MSCGVDCGLTALSVTLPAEAVADGMVNMNPEAALGIQTTCPRLPPVVPAGVEPPPPDDPPPQPEAISAIGIARITAILAAFMCGVLPFGSRRRPVIGARYTIRGFVNIRCGRSFPRTGLVASDPM